MYQPPGSAGGTPGDPSQGGGAPPPGSPGYPPQAGGAPQFPPQPPPSYPQPPPGGGYGQPSYAPGGYAAPRPTDSLAIWSLVLAGLSIPGLFLCCLPGIVMGAVAFFLGNSSLSRIRQSNGMWGGEGLAQAGRISGLIIAILGLLLLVLVIINAIVNPGSTNNATSP